MKRLLMAMAVCSTLAVTTPAAQAATTPGGNFNVTVTLTSVCTMGVVTPLAFGTYTAFQAGAQTATPTTATLTCTRGLTGVTAAFDNVAAGSTADAAATNAVGAGVLAGLEYSILATPSAVVAGTAATASTIGTADSLPYVISGSMPALQAGTASAGEQSQQRTLTITY
jgi:spore coat protein U-like protein